MNYGAMDIIELPRIGTSVEQGLASFSVKGQIINSVGFAIQLQQFLLQQFLL